MNKEVFVVVKSWDLSDEGKGTAILGVFTTMDKSVAVVQSTFKETKENNGFDNQTELDRDWIKTDDVTYWEYHFGVSSDYISVTTFKIELDAEYQEDV